MTGRHVINLTGTPRPDLVKARKKPSGLNWQGYNAANAGETQKDSRGRWTDTQRRARATVASRLNELAFEVRDQDRELSDLLNEQALRVSSSADLTTALRAGDVTFFDPTIHLPVSGRAPAPGTKVEVRTPGYKHRGEQLTLSTVVRAKAPAKPSSQRASARLTAKPKPDLTGIAAGMRAADSREQADQLLDGLTNADLRDLGADLGTPLGSNMTKAQLRQALVQHAAGFRLDHAAIMGSVRETHEASFGAGVSLPSPRTPDGGNDVVRRLTRRDVTREEVEAAMKGLKVAQLKELAAQLEAAGAPVQPKGTKKQLQEGILAGTVGFRERAAAIGGFGRREGAPGGFPGAAPNLINASAGRDSLEQHAFQESGWPIGTSAEFMAYDLQDLRRQPDASTRVAEKLGNLTPQQLEDVRRELTDLTFNAPEPSKNKSREAVAGDIFGLLGLARAGVADPKA